MNASNQSMGKCPQCGVTLPAGALAGLCPACLLKEGAAADTGTQPGVKPFDPPPVAEVARLFPQFEIIALLGKGGMGAVYKARQPALDRFVALKILPTQGGADAGFAERFTREARALARLGHPNIVALHEFGQADGLHFFIMEFVDGVNLRQLQKTGRLSPREALQIVPQICDALQYAHDEGVVHRDIKPENVLVDRKGRVKIADFGLAKILGLEAQDLRLTGEGQVMGTPHYMAPEQVEHPLTVDHRADIFSLGVVFYEMLTGELPLGKFAPPSRKVQVDVRLDEIVLHALEKEPELRYQQANEVKTAVQNVTSGAAVGTVPNPQGLVSVPRWATGVEYRSKATLCGLPLVHVATGMDPTTGKRRVATGIFALGNIARGWVAIGGVAMGGFAFGGLALGGIAFGGLGIGAIALGGLALGLIGAQGGGAIAPVAIGGGSVGYWAYGGAAWGPHAFSGFGADPRAWDFFEPWVRPLEHWFLVGTMLLAGTIVLLATLLPAWLQRRQRAAVPSWRVWGEIAIAVVCAGLCFAPVPFLSAQRELGPHGLVSGRVTNEDGESVADATVTIFASNDAEQSWDLSRAGAVRALATSTIGPNGDFSVFAPKAGDRLIVSAPGQLQIQTNLSAAQFDRKRHARVDLKLAWSPIVPSGLKPDPNQIREEANKLRDAGQYDEALQRYQWYWNHAVQYDPGQAGVRRSFLLSDWVELGKREPHARAALVHIRDRDAQELLIGGVNFDLFMDVSYLNQYLGDENATYKLFIKMEQKDQALAQRYYELVEGLLVRHGDYELCYKLLGDPEAAFEQIRRKRDWFNQVGDRREQDAQRMARQIPGYQIPQPPKPADRNFVDGTRQLILILVKTGHQAQAGRIRDKALAVLDDPRLQSAVTDAEHTPASQ